MRKHRRNLERAHKPEAGHIGRSELGNVTPVIEDLAAGRLEKLGEQVETGGFASTIGANDRVDRPAPHLDVHTFDSHESLEFFRECPCFQNDVAIVPH